MYCRVSILYTRFAHLSIPYSRCVTGTWAGCSPDSLFPLSTFSHDTTVAYSHSFPPPCLGYFVLVFVPARNLSFNSWVYALSGFCLFFIYQQEAYGAFLIYNMALCILR